MRDDCPRTASPPDCLDDNLVAGFVEGVLASGERARVERLIDQCAVCRRQVSEVMRVRSTLGAPSEAATPPPPPERIGRYEVRGTLGQGGMGVVLRAWDPQLEREVAVKLVRGGSADGALRLVREARAMAKVRHPAVITVHDAGILGGEVFVVMELVDGENLSEWYARKPPWREVLARCKVAGTGLAAAHARGLVHRDFKPHNVLCDRDGRVLVADFGLARGSPGVTDAASALTGTGAVVGTPAYMAPEQHLGEKVGPAADQFAFAATLYEGLYGQRPFPGTTLAALISEVLSGQVRPPPAASDVPPALAKVVLRGLARDPADRWPSMQAMLDALEAPALERAAPRSWPAPAVAAAVVAGVTAASLITWTLVRDDRDGTRAAKPTEPAPAPAVAGDAAPTPPAKLDPDLATDRLAAWDVLGELAAMDALARAWAPDARLWKLGAGRVGPDGVIDVATDKGGNPDQVSYHYVSATRRPGCWLELMIREGRFHDLVMEPASCTEYTALPPPRCTIADMTRRLVAEGADPARGFGVGYELEDDEPRWILWQGNLRRSYPDGDCDAATLPPIDRDRFARWDALGDREPIDARAKAWADDAVLQAIQSYGVGPDGSADITAGGWVQYLYRSARIAASDDLAAAQRCMQVFDLKSGALAQSESQSSNCPELRAPGPPRCTFADIWRRAKADGADPSKPARIDFLYLSMGAPHPIWLFHTKKLQKQYPDDC